MNQLTEQPTSGLQLYSGNISPAIMIMLDERLFERAKQISTYMSKAQGFTPRHLIGKPEACFAVVTRAITWRLDPFAVAQSTFDVKGTAGYKGKLCQAILENSGKLVGGVEFEHYGDWTKVAGKFEIKKGDNGEYAARTWGRNDAEGLGVIVKATVKGESKPRTLDFALNQAFPLFSTMWATDPKTQICYTAVRRFADVAMPGIMMGVPFDDEAIQQSQIVDVTPKTSATAAELNKEFLDIDPGTGEVKEEPPADANPTATDTIAPEPTIQEKLVERGQKMLEKLRSMKNIPGSATEREAKTLVKALCEQDETELAAEIDKILWDAKAEAVED